jgi:histone deacetylase 11
MSIVYTQNYNMGLFGLEQMHPFDVKKFGRAWKLLQSELGPLLKTWHVEVDRPVTDGELLAVHSREHLQRLREPAVLAKAFEVPAVELVPYSMIESGFLTPMRWAVRGSVIAARQALLTGVAINLAGGFHHAKPDKAEGFCLFSDIALIVAQLRADESLRPDARIAYIDLDAHQGNGVCYQFMNDSRCFLFDIYNESIYPTSDRAAIDRIDCAVPVPMGCPGNQYLELLREQLPSFLDSITRSGDVGLAIYNAGTDVFEQDELGLLSLTADDILMRDEFVLEELRRRQLPSVMLLSGGYTSGSHRLVATSVGAILKRYRL